MTALQHAESGAQSLLWAVMKLNTTHAQLLRSLGTKLPWPWPARYEVGNCNVLAISFGKSTYYARPILLAQLLMVRTPKLCLAQHNLPRPNS